MSPRARLRRALRLWPWLAVLLVIGLAVGLGGFARRTDKLQPAALGAEIDSHNLVFIINAATLQAVPRTSGAAEWKVEVAGSVRNPNDEALAAILGPNGNFMPMTIEFTLPADYTPQAGIEMAVAPMEHTANGVLGLNDGELVWNIDSYASASLLQLPLTRVPDAPR